METDLLVLFFSFLNLADIFLVHIVPYISFSAKVYLINTSPVLLLLFRVADPGIVSSESGLSEIALLSVAISKFYHIEKERKNY